MWIMTSFIHMAKRYTTQLEHDQVVLASADTYNNYRDKGYIISANLTGKECHDIGQGIYPDLVVWRTGGEYGRTLIIEEVETAESINFREAKQWKKYANLNYTFYLIVPEDYITQTQEILDKENIKVDLLEYYYFDEEDRIRFSTRNDIPLVG